MNDSALIRARAGDHQAFAALADPYRRELQLHCYRILGQVQDAEDAVQETLLSAWRALESVEERSTLRSWLYRIATNRCLNMLRASGRRPAPAAARAYTPPEPTRYGEVLWLEPYPDALLDGIADRAAGPEARYETREAITLAFLTALHRLPPRQRAVLVLRDVLGFSATEVAAMLDTTPTSVNNAVSTNDFPVLSAGPTPHTPLHQWNLTINGEVDEPASWTWEASLDLPSETPTVDISCVTKWTRLDTTWRGVSVDTPLSAVDTEAKYLTAWSDGGYTTNLTIEDVTGGKAWVAYEFEGEPLDPEHGGPARLLVPHLYFWKSAKWVRGLTLTRDDQPGFWEGHGYHNHGDPWREQRYQGD